uniref:Ubiquitin-related modifier 1 n=2 Tax=Panagrolaimus sp. JU765 TaxID=591449 RepID=A0AC34R0B7_9BILA
MSEELEKKKLTLSFLGGVEESFGTRSMEVEVPGEIKKMTQFIQYLFNVILKDSPGKDELLVDENTVKPGILVLHNNRDINLFEQATADEVEDETEEEEPFELPDEFSLPNKKNGQIEQVNGKESTEKLRINDGDEISFLSIIHGG